jgi:uncharacterized damage-inducible protein DinB
MKNPEPWLRGTLTDVNFVQRGVLHAIEQAREDVARWCEGLTTQHMYARPADAPSIAFHLRHIAHSLDRLLTYAEGRSLDPAQFEALDRERREGESREELMSSFYAALSQAEARVRGFDPAKLEEGRFAGRRYLPTTVGGILIHCAEHTLRHVGQIITTVKVVRTTRR